MIFDYQLLPVMKLRLLELPLASFC